MAKASLSILIPVLNEEANLVPLIEELESVLRPLGRSFEIIVVDDGSSDESPKILERMARGREHLKVLFFRRNSGQTAAFDAGFRSASGDFIVTMDSDLQNDPHDIPKMLEMVEVQGYDFVVGWRRKRKDKFLWRTFPSILANKIIRGVTKAPIHDLGCSLKIYRKELAKELRLYGEMHRFIGVLMTQLGAKVGEIEVNHRARRAGYSKYNLSRTFKVLLDLVTVWFLQSFRTKPSYVFGGFGFGIIGLGFSISAFVLYQKFWLGIWVHRNPLFLISIFSILIGVQFIALGLLAELIIRTYFESSQQVPYSVARSLNFEPKLPRVAYLSEIAPLSQ